MNARYSTTVINTGGRAGEAHSEDKTFSLKIVPPGSGGEGTNPEQLFAAGFGACFNSALSAVLKREKIMGASTITTTVSLYENGPLDYQIGVEMAGHIDGLSHEETMAMLEKAHQVCPYSKATRGNIEVALKAV